MKAADRPSRGTGRATAADLTASRPKPKLKKVLPEVWKLIKPRRLLLGGSFLLMIINRASGLVLPASTRYLIDNVMGKHQLYLLPMDRRRRRRSPPSFRASPPSPSPSFSPRKASASSPNSA